MQVSVYLPTHNRQARLRRAVDSVLAQRDCALELIVVDDGSTDDTPHYLQQLAAGDVRVRLLRHDSARGAPASRNAALALARGEWVTGLDDDDEFLPGRLARLLAFADFLTAAGLRFAGVFAQDLVRVADGISLPSRKRGPVAFDELFRSNLIGNQILARRLDVLAVGGFDERLPAWQDLDLLMRLTQRFGPAQLFDEPLYLFDDRPRSDRISRQQKQRLLDAFALIAARHHEQPPRLLQQLFLQAFSRSYGHRPGLADIGRYLRMGTDLSACWQLGRTCLRRGALSAPTTPTTPPGAAP
jgi:glycosyltransferase involved in cell wall biosynthesis